MYEKKNIVIYFFESYISVAPTVISIAKAMSHKGHFVNIVIRKTESSDFTFEEDNIKLHYCNTNYKQEKDDDAFFQYVECIYKKAEILDLKNSLIIGIDLFGGICAFFTAIHFKVDYIYLSLELNDNTFKEENKYMHNIEKLSYKNSKLIIVQDEFRANALNKYMNFNHQNILYLPNTVFIDTLTTKERNTFFNDRIEIPHSKKIIASIGMIDENVFSNEIAKTFNNITNEEIALVFHERLKRAKNDVVIKKINTLNKKNMYLSLEPVDYKNIHKLYSSIDIGIAYYKNINSNFGEIAKASGKLAFYLLHGKPILVNNIPSLNNFVSKYKCGIVVSNVNNPIELDTAIDKIVNNYEFYKKNALNCFYEEFDFNKFFTPIYDNIDKIIKEQNVFSLNKEDNLIFNLLILESFSLIQKNIDNKNKLNKIKNSKSFKIGKLIVYPFSLIKQYFR